MSSSQPLSTSDEKAPISARNFTASGRAWVWRDYSEDIYQGLLAEEKISDALAQLLARRDVTPPEASGFLNPTLKELLPDPSHLHDMDKGVNRLVQAIKNNEQIGIIGDYDVDGACSTAVLVHFLRSLGQNPVFIIPDRIKDGYGPQPHLIDKLIAQGSTLILTLDCGSTAIEALAHAKGKSVDLMVIDHHSMQEIPDDTYALINPNRPDQESPLKNLCAAGVVFVVLVALNRALRTHGYWQHHPEPDLRECLDLVALATVCDVMTLKGLNRAFIKWGLEKLQTPRLGVRKLMEAIGLESITRAYNLGFQIGPHINAGGRVGEPDSGTKLLLSTDEAEAHRYALQLKEFNTIRKQMEKDAITQAQRLAKDQIDLSRKFLVIHHESWHPGIIGIVAGRIKDMYHKPVAILCGEGSQVKGSARSIAGIHVGNIMQDLVTEGVLTAGGGHGMAAGLSLSFDKIELLAKRVNEIADTAHVPNPCHEVDLIVSPGGATQDLVTSLEKLEPFGNGNPQPNVVLSNAVITHIRDIKGEHAGLTLEDSSGGRLEAIAFRVNQGTLGDLIHMNKGKTCHLLGTLGFNRWNGQARPQLIVSDISTGVLTL